MATYYTFTKAEYKAMSSAQASSLGIKKASDGTYYTTKSAATKFGGVATSTKPGTSSSSSGSSGSSTVTMYSSTGTKVSVDSSKQATYEKMGYSTSAPTSSTQSTTTETPFASQEAGNYTETLSDGTKKYYLNNQEVALTDYAKAMLGSAYDPNTTTPTAETLDNIASQDFIQPEVAQSYEETKLNPVNQNYLAELSANIPKTTTPPTAAAVSSPYQPYVDSSSFVNIPTGDISSATAGTAGLGALNTSMQQFYENQLAREQEFQSAQRTSLQSLMDKLTSPAEARSNAWAETGMDVQGYYAQQEAGFKEIESLTNEYNKTVEMKDAQIAATHDKLASNNFINNQIAQIERNAAPKLNRLSADINAKAAVLQALQGNFAQAQSYVNQAVADATAQNKYLADTWSMAYEMNADNFTRVETIYSNAFQAQVQLYQAAYEQQLSEKKTIGELLLQYPNAGINIYEDDLTTAMQKAGVRAGQLESISLSQSGSGSSLTADQKNYLFAVEMGYEGSFATWLGKNGSNPTAPAFADVIQAAINSGATYQEAARAAAKVSEDRGIPVDQDTLAQWTSYAQTLTPYQPSTTEQIQSQSKYGGATISAPTGNETSSENPNKEPTTLMSIWNNLFGG